MNATIDRGRDFAITVRFWTDTTKTTPEDVTASTFAASLGNAVTAAAIVNFTIDDTDAATGIIVLRLTALQTAAIAAELAAFDVRRDGSTVVSRQLALVQTPVTP